MVKGNIISHEALEFFREAGRKGGKAGGSIGGTRRAANLTPERRSEIARKAAAASAAKRSAVKAGTAPPAIPQRPKLHCNRCNHEWFSRVEAPSTCPNPACRHPGWAIPKMLCRGCGIEFERAMEWVSHEATCPSLAPQPEPSTEK